MLSNTELFSLINVANIHSGLLTKNFVSSQEDFLLFDKKSLGIPILIPADETMFLFETKDVFDLRPDHILKAVYSISNREYIGFKHAFSRFKFLTKFRVRKAYQPYLKKLVRQNFDTIQYVNSLRSEFTNIGAFQTRNIPHFGHEKIMNCMLEHCDHLVINPVIGPKKRGDVKLESLTEVFKYLTDNKYNGKISFSPIFANMFYAGPREAMHHALMRQNIGFQYFTVGRDHAGAENVYSANMASEFIEQNKEKLEISVLQHNGAVFCSKCNKTILIGDCTHSRKNMRDISGSDFRASISERRIFPLADKKMQLYLLKSKMEIFES